MKSLFLTLLLCGVLFSLKAQKHVLDSLQLELAAAETDSLRAYWYSRMAWHSFRYDLDSAETYIRQARQICESIDYESQIAVLQHYQGLLHRLQAEYSAALDTFRQVLSYYEKQGDTLRMTSPLFNIGAIYFEIGDYEKCLEYSYRELAINEQYDKPLSIANSLNSIANVQKNQGDYEEALNTYERARKIVETENDLGQLATVLENMASTYVLLKNYEKARALSEKSLRIDEQLERPWGIAHSLTTLSQVARKQNDFPAAMEYVQRAIDLREALGQPMELSDSYLAYSELLASTNRYRTATDFAQRAIQLADSIAYLKGLRQGYTVLARIFAESNQFEKAYEAQQEAQFYQDSLLNAEKAKALKELEIRYDVQQKEIALQNLQAENELKAAATTQERRSRIAWTIATGLFALLALSTLLWYRQRLAHDRLVAEQAAALQSARIEKLEQEQKLLTLDAMINGQEEERKRIAKDLHDSLGSLLSTVKLHFRAIQRQIQQLEELDVYQTTNSLIDHASEEVRRISHNMMPDVLQLGLPEALEEIAQNLKHSTQLDVTFQEIGFPQMELTETQKIMFYRIAQELTQNVVKHAAAKKILLQLTWSSDAVQLIVEDDGTGFDTEKASKGVGLRSIASRIQYLNGTVDFDSEKNVGTTVTVIAPLLSK